MKKDKKIIRKCIAVLLVVMLAGAVLLASGCESGGGASSDKIKDAQESTAEYLAAEIDTDSPDAVTGSWIPLALRLSGTDAADDEFYDMYYDSVRVKVKTGGGMLSEAKPTENERVAMTLTAIGKDPSAVEGEDLMKFVDDIDAVKAQGLNAEIYALVSANYAGYALEHEDDYLYDIIVSQAPEGAFGMDSEHPDTDMTAMALQALSFYDGRIEGNSKSDPRAEVAVDRAIEWLKENQQEDGSFGSAESTAQVIIALSCLGRDPEGTEFSKGDNSICDGLLAYRSGEGFSHISGGEADIMATEQSMLALDAVMLAREGRHMFR